MHPSVHMYGKPVRRIGDGYVDDIHGFYKAALDRLPVRRIPALAPCLLKAGVCFGYLDPVSNIILNTIAYSQRLPSTESQETGATRKLIFSKIFTDTQDPNVFGIPLSDHMADGMTIARLSLEGLVSFLLFHFRYLAETEALRATCAWPGPTFLPPCISSMEIVTSRVQCLALPRFTRSPRSTSHLLPPRLPSSVPLPLRGTLNQPSW